MKGKIYEFKRRKKCFCASKKEVKKEKLEKKKGKGKVMLCVYERERSGHI